jgi:Txe/YoeB family toxin of Txe-Axe toxin-antitoxin module
MTVTKDELLWMAGFFDGEGSVFIHTVSPKRNRRGEILALQVRVANTKEESLRPFFDNYGGHIGNSLPKAYNPRWQPKRIYYWMASHRKAARFLTDILPYLKLKEPQARLGLEFEALKQANNGHGSRTLSNEENLLYEAYRQEMKELNA